MSAIGARSKKEPLVNLLAAPLNQGEVRLGGLRSHHHHTLGNKRESDSHSFLGKLIVATRTSVSVNPDLKGLGVAETTRPKKWPKHLPGPPLLASLLLAPAIGRRNVGFYHHK